MVDHIDRDKNNYHHTNLRSVTGAENAQNVTPYKKGREVLQLDNEGMVLAEHSNCVEAASKLSGDYKGINIAACAHKNERKDAKSHKSGAYIWIYKYKKEQYKCVPGENFKLLQGDFQGVVINYDSYALSNFGTLINVGKGYKKKFSYNLGYPRCSLSFNNERKTYYVHDLIGLLFINGRTEQKNQVNHKNEDITDFSVDNLEWVTQSENANHSKYKHSNPVKKICMKTGETLQIYNSSVDAAKDCGNKSAPHIRNVCGKQPRYAYGYYWEYV